MADPIGLLVVHGIGSQRRGRSLEGLLVGLGRAYGDALTVTRPTDDQARIEGIGPAPVHAVEVWWADLLDGEAVRGTFNFDRVWEVVWFPRLNRRAGALPPEVCPSGRVARWTAILAPLSALLYATYIGTRVLAAPFRSPDAPPKMAPSVAPTRFDDLMDRVAADVFNYANGLRGAFPDGDEHAALAARVPEIRVRFESAAATAVSAGCREIQVVAHSLATVIAFTSMNAAPGGAPAATRRRGSRGSTRSGAPSRSSAFLALPPRPRMVRGFSGPSVPSSTLRESWPPSSNAAGTPALSGRRVDARTTSASARAAVTDTPESAPTGRRRSGRWRRSRRGRMRRSPRRWRRGSRRRNASRGPGRGRSPRTAAGSPTSAPTSGPTRSAASAPEDLTRFTADLLAEGYAPATVQGIYAALTSGLRHALRRGAIRALPLPPDGPGIPTPVPVTTT